MSTDIKKKIVVPKDLHDSKLLCFLHPNRFETKEEKQAIELLHKICMTNLTDFHESNQIKDLILTKEEQKLVLFHEWNNSENIEVQSRCNDVLCRLEKDKRSIKVKTSNNYLVAYQLFGNIEFLIRSITVRDIKILNTDDFLKDIISAINDKFSHPFWIQKVVNSIKKSYPIEKLEELCNYIERKKNRLINGNYSEKREYIKAQYSLKVISEQVFHKEMALCFEGEADAIISDKKPNTFYLNLVDLYQSAYNEIFQIKKQAPEEFERIKDKLLQEKSNFMKMLSLYGIKTQMELSDDFIKCVKKIVSKITIGNFIDTINLMLSIPFITSKEVSAYEATVRKASPISSMFGHKQLNAKGDIVGIAEPEKSLKTEAHVYFRQKRLYAIWTYINLHQWSNIKSEENFIYLYLQKKKPTYIEEENLIFWTKGFVAGLNKDFISASHILMPYLEHALRNIAEIKKGNITTLEKKRQEAPSLGVIFPMLQGVIEEEILYEIESFLNHGIDVNFRNNLSHGLLTPFEIEKYGIYLWWICLKLYFEEKNMIKIAP
ncbi:DUF4209 domain-containing protein [Porphyromonas gingivalis]|uniref:DUF4209 domain-containing protein n=1 Tax=Porphyromonas gingivalis TaxID=837 RepID=UPI000C18B6DA|nr:DUF4209 domain-containing protein [Porphyromonas gingivalis]ATR98390.1 DUF4209 domain-containing protein [Porphyromonas gingivalis]